ncbi:Peptidase S8 and S53, subtilisin, kexin, sedolisin [Candidatus Sulfopaludibacter sp. SbA3]|nr:Peptidase S8 and S53, subtilisin, kexin, sedolisin [Candidatus Sulfopaludibacter sp. SbA3]
MFIRFRQFLALILFACCVYAQADRISAPIDARQSDVLRGHVHPLARPANDRGAVEASFPVPGMTLLLKPSAGQQAALQQLLAQQQDPASPHYHQWLTPEQYADAYGVSAADLIKIADWLKSQGFTIGNMARSRTFLTFSGTADQALNTFHTEIHRYLVNGQVHFANAAEPSVPAALSGVISGIRGLNDFRLKPQYRTPSQPQMNSGGTHSLAPDDIATIYDIAPLYQAGIDGTGQKIAVAGQTDIHASDITRFRSQFNLSASNLTQVLVPGHQDPGVVPGDMQEADLDIEWSGAVARNAHIYYVYSDDVVQSAYYAIDQNLAPVLTFSYGGCEGADLYDLPNFQTMAQQANAQGITWLAAAGDSGAAACEDLGATIAQDGLAINAPASVPEITAMGGTTFNDQGGSYWASSNTANGASALGYIPETTWNDTAYGAGLASTGGGASIFYPRPSWQTGPGVPNDGVRHIPDLALSSSADHVPYSFYSGGLGVVGGTSAASPVMAGIVALLNQYLVSTGVQSGAGLGNINPALYRLAQSTTGIFHDVTTGNNSVPCVLGSPDCTSGIFGQDAGPGYDQATGLGSVDVFNLAHGWSGRVPMRSAVTVSVDQNPVFRQSSGSGGNPWQFTLTITEEAGVPTTLTAVTIDGVSFISKMKTALPAFGSESVPIGLSNVAAPKNVAFVVSGIDASGTTWTQQFAIPFAGPQIPLTITAIGNGASYQPVFAPGMILTVYGTGLGNFAQSFGTVPLPQYLAGFEASVNGVPAPLYYVSPTQVNLQIPYETAPGPATLTVGNPYPYDDITYNFQVAASAPGIFTQADGSLTPFASAARNQTITLYLTGDGQVSPSLATGTAPSVGTPLSRLPKPRLAVTVTVGGVPATTTFVGIPTGYVGVTQINFTVPANAPTGVQPVVVTVGAAASAAAKLTVQ